MLEKVTISLSRVKGEMIIIYKRKQTGYGHWAATIPSSGFQRRNFSFKGLVLEAKHYVFHLHLFIINPTILRYVQIFSVFFSRVSWWCTEATLRQQILIPEMSSSQRKVPQCRAGRIHINLRCYSKKRNFDWTMQMLLLVYFILWISC